jgi:hypothetical protein
MNDRKEKLKNDKEIDELNLEPGTKCLVWGKKSSEENGVIKYFVFVNGLKQMFYANNKTTAVQMSKSFSRSIFGFTGLTTYTNFKILEE